MTKHYQSPPNWPPPPSPQWQPPPKWKPDPAWSAPPKDWAFWVDDTGQPTAPPPNTYPGSALTRKQIAAGCGGLTLLTLLLLGSCGAILASGDEEPTAVTVTPTTTVTPTKTLTPTVAVTPTVTAPQPTKTAAARTRTVTPTVTVNPPPPPEPEPEPKPQEDEGGESVYYDNCDAVRAAGADPIRRGDPGYDSHLDRDGDGVGCEN